MWEFAGIATKVQDYFFSDIRRGGRIRASPSWCHSVSEVIVVGCPQTLDGVAEGGRGFRVVVSLGALGY